MLVSFDSQDKKIICKNFPDNESLISKLRVVREMNW